MSNDFKKVLVKDDRLMVTDSLNYAVYKGGQNVTNVRMPAISSTPASLNFVVPFPSESTLLDREVFLKTQTDYYLTFASAVAGLPQYITDPDVSGFSLPTYTCPLKYGFNLSIASYPTQRSMDTIQVQLNNNISVLNCADVLPALLRCSDAVEWERYNMTASSVDRLQKSAYETASTFNNNLASYDLAQGNKYLPNGSFPNTLIALDPTTPVNPDGTPNILPAYTEAGTANFLLRVQSTEPLLAPPFIWNQTLSNKMGIYGLQNMSVVCNYGNLQRSLKYSAQSGISTNGQFSGEGGEVLLPSLSGVRQVVNNAELQMKYITPHSTDIMAQRNVIPYLEYPRFITSGLPSIANATTSEVDGVGLVINPVPVQLQSQTFTFNQVPDKLIIYVRPDSTYRNDATYNDFVLPISSVSIQWNNHAGILANASQEQLFHMSQEAGSNQNWLDFIGYANANSQRLAGTLSEVFQVYPFDGGGTVGGQPQVAQNGVIPNQVQLPTVGSYLMLDMARHLELTESYYAPGSLGSFQLQFSVNVLNTILNDGTNISVNPEIVVIPVNSGLMVTERGQTSCYTGILTKQDVLDASLQEPLSHLHVSRVVGRGHQDSGRSLPKHILPGMTRKNFAPASNASMDKRLM